MPQYPNTNTNTRDGNPADPVGYGGTGAGGKASKPSDGKEFEDTRVPKKPGDQRKVPKEVQGKSPTEMAERWEKELQAAKKELQKFHSTGRKLTQKYLDERDSAQLDNVDAKLNLFWSNIEVLKASLYAKPPNVDVSNTHKDNNDDISRVASTILQRMLNHDVADDDESTYPDVTRQSVGDYLVVGLGQVWYRYEVETEEASTEPVIDPVTGTTLAEAIDYEVITEEDAPADYVYWEDFAWSPCRVWQDCRWVARRVFMNREELTARFGEKIGKEIPVTKSKAKNDGIGPQNDPWEKAGVWEIWDKTTKCAYWHVMGFNVICDYKPDPLGLRGFFPCPQPLIANATTSRFMPRADYLLAQDQYQQIDELTTRLKYLIRACKVAGAYDKNNTALGRVFTEGLENQMIPVDNWAAFSEKGGLKGSMDFVPIEVIAQVIDRLTAQRDVLKGNLYEVLGIGDIMRGMTNPDETLGAQQLKAQFGGNRLQFKQQQIGAWVASGQRIRSQIICDKFQPATIAERSNIENSVDAPFAQQAIEFLKDPGNSKFYRIAVESETMAMVDWAQERDSRVQFMEAAGNFMNSTMQFAQGAPAAMPVLFEMLKWGLGGFRVSKEIETVLDQAIAAVSQPEEPQPNPLEDAQVAKVGSETLKNKTQAVKNLADAGQRVTEKKMVEQGRGKEGTTMPAMPAEEIGPGGMQMQPPAEGVPLEPPPPPEGML
jgi:hypothetical protein